MERHRSSVVNSPFGAYVPMPTEHPAVASGGPDEHVLYGVTGVLSRVIISASSLAGRFFIEVAEGRQVVLSSWVGASLRVVGLVSPSTDKRDDTRGHDQNRKSGHHAVERHRVVGAR